MRKPHRDMARIDDRILEYTFDCDFGSSRPISDSPFIYVSQAYVSRRLRKLTSLDLMCEVGRGVYQLTHEGCLYLASAYNADSGVYVDGIDPDQWQCSNWAEVAELTQHISELERDDQYAPSSEAN